MRLLPQMRSHGYSKVLAGAKLSLRDRASAAKNLNNNLAEQVRSISVIEFRDATFDVLAGEHSKLEGETRSLYSAVTEELFSGLSSPPMGQSILDQATEILSKFMKRCRYSGNESLKHVMDVITYEAQAEFNRAYSVVWSGLIAILAKEISAESQRFLNIWHTDLSVPSNQDPMFHLFHGKVLGLHPCGSILMNSKLACRILGEFIAADQQNCGDEFGRLLWALRLAVHQYVESRNDQSERRRRREQPASDIDTRARSANTPDQFTGQSRVSDEFSTDCLPDALEQYASDELITCCGHTMRHLSHTIEAGQSITAVYRCDECNAKQAFTLRAEDLL